jgi:hypothetical protein
MTVQLRLIHEYTESDGWMTYWKSQSFETACQIRDSIASDRNPLVVATGEPALPFATVSQRFESTNEFPMDRWRLVGKEYSKHAAIRLRDVINRDGVRRQGDFRVPCRRGWGRGNGRRRRERPPEEDMKRKIDC